MSELCIIKQIENKLNVKLEETDKINPYGKGNTLDSKEQVTSLSLFNCRIVSLNSIISLLKELKQLQSLYLIDNQISDISFLKELKQLQSLSLRDNQISDISFLKELKQLQSLDLRDNRINDISFLKGLKQLQSLDLSSNRINDISFLKELKQLQSLDLRDNRINDISFLKGLKQLQSLDLIGNQINDVPFLKELKQLKWLYLSSLQISDISFLKELKQLLWLDLRDNQISDISFLKGLKQLLWLNLRENQISDISFLKDLKQLKWLYLSNNKIKDIHVLRYLKCIETVDLNMNEIKELPSWITNLEPSITGDSYCGRGMISVSDNPIIKPPIEIVRRGREAIKNYFDSLVSKKKVKLNEVKVLLVGEGMSGKTSLLKQFQGLPFDKNESQTHGINVASLPTQKLEGLDNSNELKNYYIHFWDFGGQEIMHASHQFFLSKRSLYILVIDSRTDSKKYHWLKHIEKFGGDSPLIVVMNKIDVNPSYNIEQKRINESFPHIKNRFYRISCRNKQGFSELVKCLVSTIPETSLFETYISIDWMNIKEKLVKETKANRYINREMFVNICQDNNVTDQNSQQTLLQYLNDLGIVLYFKQLNLANIYVLDPHWVTIGVYKIINSQKNKDGILCEQDLDYILNKEEIKKHEYDPAKEKNIVYSPEEQHYILSIMMHFELCYEYDRNKNHYIIPDLLPKELANEPELNQETMLHFTMIYDYLPSTILPRLMLRLKNDIVDNQQWKYGMILDNKEFGCQAKIKEDESNKRIDITVQGESLCKQKYFSAIWFNIHAINKDFENLIVQEFIPLPGYPELLVEYKELLGYERAKREEYFVGKLGKSFSVSDMLDSVINKQERAKEMDDRINISFSNIGNPQQMVAQQVEQTATQQQTVSQEIKTVQGLFKNLKEDILTEIEIEIEDKKEKKRISKDLENTENAFLELRKASAEGRNELPISVKNRIEEFIDNLSDKNSRLNKALNLVSKGADKIKKLSRFYNKVAPYFALPSIPPVLLGE